MGRKHSAYKMLMLLALAQPVSAYAADKPAPLEPLNLEAKYMVAWNGITIGRVYMTAHEDSKTYSLSVDTKTHGIASLFSNERRIAEANGTVHNGHYSPLRYASLPQDKDEGRHTTLDYDASGKLSKRERIPDDDPTWRAPVPEAKLFNTTDPVTAGFILRHHLYDALAKDEDEAQVKTYDGARLATMSFKVVKPSAKVEIMGKYEDSVTTIAERHPIAGYTSKELKIFTKGDPVVHLYFSADSKFIPIHATVSTLFGELSATLTEIK